MTTENFGLIPPFTPVVALRSKVRRRNIYEMDPEKYLDCDGGGLPDFLAVNRVGFILVRRHNTQRCVA